MGKPLNNLLSLIPTYSRLIVYARRQKKFLRSHIEPLLEEYKVENDGSLAEKDFEKITRYYGLGVPAFVGEVFCMLRAQPMSESERWASTAQGVITGLYDDFFDDDGKFDEEWINAMLGDPEVVAARSTHEKLFLQFAIKVYESAKFPEWVKESIPYIHDAQVESMKLEDLALKPDAIWEITKKKGGYSALFWRSAFDHEIRNGESDALYQLGVLGQFANDVFDVYKDHKSKFTSLMTTTSDISTVRRKYENELQLLIDYCRQMDYPKKQIDSFLAFILSGLFRALVAFDQYESLQRSNKGVFDPNHFTRKQLIVDMESPKNLLKLAAYSIKTSY